MARDWRKEQVLELHACHLLGCPGECSGSVSVHAAALKLWSLRGAFEGHADRGVIMVGWWEGRDQNVHR